MALYIYEGDKIIIGISSLLKVNPIECIDCHQCVGMCPTDAIKVVGSGVDVGNGTVWGSSSLRIYPEECIVCGDCAGVCPTSALLYFIPGPPGPDPAYGGPQGDDKVEVGDEGEKVKTKDELKCFDKSQGAKLTIYVQQPDPNTRIKIGTNQVGHAFVGIEQGGLTRYMGFYPNNPQASVISSQPSEIHDNSGTMYHVSISINIDAAHLTQVINYINSAPTSYDLNKYNCADFAIGVAEKGGLTLPKTVGTQQIVGPLKFEGHNPGDLGEDIREMPTPAGATKNGTGGNAPTKKGGC